MSPTKHRDGEMAQIQLKRLRREEQPKGMLLRGVTNSKLMRHANASPQVKTYAPMESPLKITQMRQES